MKPTASARRANATIHSTTLGQRRRRFASVRPAPSVRRDVDDLADLAGALSDGVGVHTRTLVESLGASLRASLGTSLPEWSTAPPPAPDA